MRVKLAYGAAVAATIVSLTGCQSGAGGSGRTWWGAKNKPSTTAPAYSNAPAGPQLPSAAASPSSSGSAQGYASVPPGAAAANPTASAAGTYPNTQTTYPTTNDAAQGAAGGASVPSTPSTGAMPQNGPYASVYNQNPGGAPVTTAQATYPPTNYPSTNSPTNTDPNAGAAAANNTYPGAPAGIRTADATGGSAYGATANSGYGGANNTPPVAAPTASPGYQYPDPGRAVDQPGTSPYSAPAGGAAAPVAAGTGYGDPTAQGAPAGGAAGAYAPPGGAYPATGYPTTGNNTGDTYPQTNYSQSDAPYNPANGTGYSPPGTAPYQGTTTPPATTTPSSERRDPNWRPGSTSDFSPSRSSGVISAGYQTPAGGSATNGSTIPYAGGNPSPAYGNMSTPANIPASNPAYGAPAGAYNPNAAPASYGTGSTIPSGR